MVRACEEVREGGWGGGEGNGDGDYFTAPLPGVKLGASSAAPSAHDASFAAACAVRRGAVGGSIWRTMRAAVLMATTAAGGASAATYTRTMSRQAGSPSTSWHDGRSRRGHGKCEPPTGAGLALICRMGQWGKGEQPGENRGKPQLPKRPRKIKYMQPAITCDSLR